ncbi:cytidylyltransferase domain-containing protein [Knoellia sp. CPCC 206450]|uniref:cytidylyltransferase domain-containing protein n=1 Tax=Knoellia tibetensis TaxID=3404798 RepID=UPI003B42CDFE
MRTRVVIQSRLNSSRLPGKALLSLAGMPLVELVARRAANTGHEVVVATSDEQYDRRIAEHLESVGIDVVRGSLDDVLGRFVTATEGLDPTDRVVRLTGDNPVADGSLIDELLAAVDASPHDYGRVDIDRVPEGFGAEVFSARVLRAAAAEAVAPYDREHVTPWIRRTGEHLFVPEDAPTDLHAYRCTVDCLDDYDRVCGAFAGVTDPLRMPWRELVARIGERVLAEGPVLPRVAGVSPVMLGSSALPQDGAALRSLLTTAVTHGVSHALLDDATARARFRTGSDPALKQRMSVVARVVLPMDASPAALDVEVERILGDLARRVDTLLLDAGDDLDRAATALGRLASYVEAGAAVRLGLALPVGAHVTAELLARVGWLHVKDADKAARLAERVGSGAVVSCDLDAADTPAPAGVVGVVPAGTPADVLAAVERAAEGAHGTGTSTRPSA